MKMKEKSMYESRVISKEEAAALGEETSPVKAEVIFIMRENGLTTLKIEGTLQDMMIANIEIDKRLKAEIMKRMVKDLDIDLKDLVLDERDAFGD